MYGINIKVVLSLIVIAASVCVQFNFDLVHNFFKTTFTSKSNKGVYKPEQLSLYNGVDKDPLYLALLGTVFDVTEGSKHYAIDSSYHYFIGKDGSRAFITGNFKDDSKEKDHVLDMTCDDLFNLLNWRKTFRHKYPSVGVLVGRYYDEQGKETVYSKELKSRINQCRLGKEAAKKEDARHPPCNVEWDAEAGTRVWCTSNSGGIVRSWVGVPRQLYSPGDDRPRCVCVNLQDMDTDAMFKEYPNCPITSLQCSVES